MGVANVQTVGSSALINLGKKTMTGTAILSVLDMVTAAGIKPQIGDVVMAIEDGQSLGSASTCILQDRDSGTWVEIGASTRYPYPVVHGKFSATVAFNILYAKLREV